MPRVPKRRAGRGAPCCSSSAKEVPKALVASRCCKARFYLADASKLCSLRAAFRAYTGKSDFLLCCLSKEGAVFLTS